MEQAALSPYIPLLAMILLACGTATGMIVIATFIGPKISFPEKLEPFECGEPQIVSPKQRFSVRFYIIAMVFIIFDIEAVFLFPWSVIFKQLGIFGFVEMMVFIFVLTVGLVYVWKKGALEWE